MNLRPYQSEAIDALYRWFETHTGNPLVVLPTGAGKSVVLATFVRQVLEAFPNERILAITHVKELIEQNHAALLRLWPEAPAGIYSAGIGRRDADARILFGGIQSVHKKADKIGWADLILVDEAHLIPSDGFGMYRRFIDDLASINPKLKVIGLTATPFRTDSGRLDTGGGRIFHGIAYDAGIADLIEQGYLSPVTCKATASTIDTTDVHRRGGDFVESELQAAALAGDNVPRAVAEMMQRGQGRKAMLVFCCGIAHARRVAEELQRHGVDCATIFGSTPKGEREDIIERFKARQLRAIVNVNVLTTGFDAPHVDLVAILRPTLSPGLYVQMVGRGLRLAEGKTNCLVLDFGGNVRRHGPIDDVVIREPGQKGDGTPPAKECPSCAELVAAGVRECPECGYEFPPPEPKHEDRPDENVHIVNKPAIERWSGVRVRYSHHHNRERPLPVMRVEYEAGFQQRASEWVCFEHDGFARRKAESWWRNHGGNEPVPSSVDEAIVRATDCKELLEPFEVVVDTRGKYPEVKGVRFREPGDEPDVPPANTEFDLSSLPF